MRVSCSKSQNNDFTSNLNNKEVYSDLCKKH